MKFDYINPEEIIEVNSESISKREKLTYLIMTFITGCYDLNKEQNKNLDLESIMKTAHSILIDELATLKMTNVQVTYLPFLENRVSVTNDLIVEELRKKGKKDLECLMRNTTHYSMLCFVIMSELLQIGVDMLGDQEAKRIFIRAVFDDILKDSRTGTNAEIKKQESNPKYN